MVYIWLVYGKNTNHGGISRSILKRHTHTHGIWDVKQHTDGHEPKRAGFLPTRFEKSRMWYH